MDFFLFNPQNSHNAEGLLAASCSALEELGLSTYIGKNKTEFLDEIQQNSDQLDAMTQSTFPEVR